MSKIFKPDADQIRPAGGKIIPAEAVSAISEARRILETARSEAERIVATAQIDHEKAVERGIEEGRTQGLAEWLEQVDKLRAALHSTVEQAKPQVVRLALRVAEKILRQRLDLAPEAILPMIDEALRSIRSQPRIVLHVHPDDCSLIENEREAWLKRHPRLGAIDVVAEETLIRGGCRIETEFGSVDTTIANQLRVMERQLIGGSGGSER